VLDQVLDQRLWLHERVPTMEFSAECTRLAFGEQWERHEKMLARASSLRREMLELDAMQQITDGTRILKEETRGAALRYSAKEPHERVQTDAAPAGAVAKSPRTAQQLLEDGVVRRPRSAALLAGSMMGGGGGGGGDVERDQEEA